MNDVTNEQEYRDAVAEILARLIVLMVVSAVLMVIS